MKKYLSLFCFFVIFSFAYSEEFTNVELQNIVNDYYYENNRADRIWEKGRSSVLVESNQPKDFYEWKNLIDNDVTTSWVEGRVGPGIGEYICLNVLRLDEFDTLHE